MTRFSALALAFVLAGGSFAWCQTEEAPPIFSGDNTIEVARNLGTTPAGPFDNFEAYDANDPPRELDLVFITLEVIDPDLPDDTLFARKMSEWVPFRQYQAPEPGPIADDTEGFIGAPILLLDTGRAEIGYLFQIPEFQGVNQARLRGLINYDVAWAITIDIANEEAPDFFDTEIINIVAVENANLRPTNSPPVADAGGDTTVLVDTTVTLDGGRTFDGTNVGFDPRDPAVFERDTLSFAWEWVSGPQRVDPTVSDADFPERAVVVLDEVGVYVFRLTVQDGVNPAPSTDEVTITAVSARPVNRKPTARIVGPTEKLVVGDVITLDGTSSTDPDGDALTFRWRQTNELGGNLTTDDVTRDFQPLAGQTEPISTWQAITPGTYYFRLLVNDGVLSDTVRFQLDVIDSATAGIQISAQGAPAASDDAADSPLLAPVVPGACGGSLAPLAVVPLALAARRRRRT